MSGVIANRLFPILQLTRMALVFTAISNSLCTLLLWVSARTGQTGSAALRQVSWREAGLVVLISTGLYGFGMSLNDIIDRRRDRLLAAHRPLPSGRIAVTTAHMICSMLILLALLAGAAYAHLSGQGWISMLLVVWTALLILFYDLAAKYLVALGLLSLGLIRFFHAVIPAPQLPLIWHPLLLLNHVTVVSLVAYRWEEKRPPLTPIHWAAVPGGLVVIDALLIGLVAWRRTAGGAPFDVALRITPALIIPGAAVVVFLVLAGIIRRTSATPREAGQRLMLYGLLWLIVYDFSFAAGYVGLAPALVLLALLPLAYVSVQVMRWWGGVMALSQRPQFKRIET
jgi:4-hydroxybenzoate polyprenyltransferase